MNYRASHVCCNNKLSYNLRSDFGCRALRQLGVDALHQHVAPPLVGFFCGFFCGSLRGPSTNASFLITSGTMRSWTIVRAAITSPATVHAQIPHDKIAYS
jgi:hypothetical protein